VLFLMAPAVRGGNDADGNVAALAAALKGPAARLGVEPKIPELVAGKAVSWELPAEHDTEVASASVVLIDAPLERLVDDLRTLEILRKAGALTATAPFSSPPSLNDVAKLNVPEPTLEAMARARIRKSNVKLSAAEIAAARRAKPADRPVIFKGFLLRRMLAWQQRGVEGLGTYDDKRLQVDQSKATAGLIASLAKTRPADTLPVTSKLQYWSIEQYGTLKPVIALSEMTIMRSGSRARVETVMIYSNHYFEGLVTALDFEEVTTSKGPATLVRLAFHSRLDIFDGLLSGIKLYVARSRTTEEMGKYLERLRESYAAPLASPAGR
jgi:hypothetical protein